MDEYTNYQMTHISQFYFLLITNSLFTIIYSIYSLSPSTTKDIKFVSRGTSLVLSTVESQYSAWSRHICWMNERTLLFSLLLLVLPFEYDL
jgi:hypothetical protein